MTNGSSSITAGQFAQFISILWSVLKDMDSTAAQEWIDNPQSLIHQFRELLPIQSLQGEDYFLFLARIHSQNLGLDHFLKEMHPNFKPSQDRISFARDFLADHKKSPVVFDWDSADGPAWAVTGLRSFERIENLREWVKKQKGFVRFAFVRK